jgi:hypothetical protein
VGTGGTDAVNTPGVDASTVGLPLESMILTRHDALMLYVEK